MGYLGQNGTVPQNVFTVRDCKQRSILFRRYRSKVSQWLGHAQLESTLVYAHADTEQKRAAIEKANGSDLLRSLSLDKAQIMKEDDLLRKLCGLM